MTAAQRDLAAFLGKKNFKGIYARNPLARSPAYAKFDRETAFMTSYPVRANHRRGTRLTDWPQVFSTENVEKSRQPFAQNPLTKSNRRVGESLRRAIIADYDSGESVQRISFKYGLVVPRVEALVKLTEVRRKQEAQAQASDTQTKKISLAKEISKMATAMESLFDEIPVDKTGKPLRRPENLTEIPIPREVSQQLFQSIAESEPFGPVDAAKSLGIEPAKVILEKLTEVGDEYETQNHAQESAKPSKVSFFAEQLDGERHRFRFTDSRVGKVGYHYGASRDDRKHARRVRFLPNGRAAYPDAENSH